MKHASPQDQYERYYFYFNDDGLLTCQLTNETNRYCIEETFKAISEVHRQAKELGKKNISASPSTTLRDAQGDSDSLSDAQAQLNQVDNRSAESAPEGER